MIIKYFIAGFHHFKIFLKLEQNICEHYQNDSIKIKIPLIKILHHIVCRNYSVDALYNLLLLDIAIEDHYQNN